MGDQPVDPSGADDAARDGAGAPSARHALPAGVGGPPPPLHRRRARCPNPHRSPLSRAARAAASLTLALTLALPAHAVPAREARQLRIDVARLASPQVPRLRDSPADAARRCRRGMRCG